jgi:hypothetical protein
MGVKTPLYSTVHLAVLSFPVVEADHEFPEVVRMVGMYPESFTLGQALDNAEEEIQRAERTYAIHGASALTGLLQRWPGFIHHPRVARLYQEVITHSGASLPQPPGRPRKPLFLDGAIIYGTVERLRQEPFKLSLRKSWEKIAQSWQSSYSSVRDAYQRGKKTSIPVAVRVPTLSPQQDSGGFSITVTLSPGQIKLAPGEFVYRRPLLDEVQTVYKLRCAESGSIDVSGWFETSGKRCHVSVRVIDHRLKMCTQQVGSES